jgi:TRAP-type C4-dicarboxylate transport system permease small subunit
VESINRLLGRPRLLAAWAGGTLLVCLWIGWAIYVGTSNGWTAAVGVLITWPLLAALAALIALIVIGVLRLAQARQRPAVFPTIAGAGPPPKLPKGHDSVTTITFPS